MVPVIVNGRMFWVSIQSQITDAVRSAWGLPPLRALVLGQVTPEELRKIKQDDTTMVYEL